MSNHILQYNKPATFGIWEESLPLGNGSFGAMIDGGIDETLIRLNEESVWFGGFRNRINPDAKDALEQVRELIFKGQLKDAENIAYTKMFGTPYSQGHYEPLADMKIIFNKVIPHHSEIGHVRTKGYSNYNRKLDLSNGIYNCSYNIQDTKIDREIFISYPDKVMAVKLSAYPKRLSFRLELDRFDLCESIYVEDNRIVLEGISGGGGTDFITMAEVICPSGRIRSAGASIEVINASEAIILVTGTTGYKANNPFVWCKETIGEAKQLGYDQLRNRHIEDYKSLYERVDFKLINKNVRYEELSTDTRLQLFKESGEDQGLMNLYFNYGRYLMISCSRKGSLPANLQGIWNKDMQPPWGSKYTININTEMNYWPAEVTNLSECHEPLFKHMKLMEKHGEIVAKEMYGCRGIVAHHNTDIFGDCAPQDQWMPATIWPMGMAWLSTHILEHYYFTQDNGFLIEYYDVLYKTVQFLLDYLIKDEQGLWVTCPSTSPENTYILDNGEKSALCYGPTMDSQIIRYLWEGFLEVSLELGISNDMIDEVKLKLTDIPCETIGSDGQILEWTKQYKEWEKGHRHISHLFGLYPGNTITKKKNPLIYEAAKVTLENRLASGGGHTGWSRAWIINFYARLCDGEAAYEHITELLTKSTADNLFDMHPPFQIDGNFGGVSGMAEMLLHSHEETIQILPALPNNWADGYIMGLKARRNITVNIYWRDKTLLYAEFLSPIHKVISVQYKETITQIELQPKELYRYQHEVHSYI